MSVVAISAAIECDQCAKRFKAFLEPSYLPPAGWSLYDCAVNVVRGGVETSEKGLTSTRGELTLCDECTREADRQSDDDSIGDETDSGDTRL